MAVEILDGTIAPAVPTYSKGSFAVFAPLRFRDRNGTERSLAKVCSGGAVTDPEASPRHRGMTAFVVERDWGVVVDKKEEEEPAAAGHGHGHGH